MKIHSVQAIPLAARFAATFRFGTIDRSDSPNVVLILRTDDGHTGYGEAVAVPAFTSETRLSIVELIETRVAPILIGRDPWDRLPLLADIAKVLRFAPFTVAAVDMALLDLQGRISGAPVHALLGGAFRTSTEVHGSVGWHEAAAEMVEVALDQAETYRTLKLYAGRGRLDEDLDRLQAVREAVRPDISLFVDINMLWEPSDLLRALPRVEEIGLQALEQPLPLAAAPLQRHITSGRSVDIIADEAVRSPADATRVVQEASATVMNVGQSKLGGLSAAMQAAQIAQAAGIGVHVGSVIEMGIATAAGLHLAAALPRLSYPSYLMGPLKYEQLITAQQFEVVNGAIAIPTGPGLGIEVDEKELCRLDLRRRP